jgi:O-antigen/teichoic acid export membrane protein
MSVKDRLARGLRATLVSRTLYILANAALMIALTRYLLTPDGYGRLTFALAVLGSMHLFLGLGWAKSGARYVTEYLETDPTQVRYVIRSTLGYVVASAVVVGTVFWLFHGDIARLLGSGAVEPFLLVGVGYLVCYPLAVATRLLFNAFNRITWSAVLRAVDGVGRLGFATLFVLVGFGAPGALLGYVAGFLVATAAGLVVLYREFYTTLPATGDRESGLRKRILRYGVPLTVTSGADVLDKRVDAILVGVIVGPVAVGFYTLAKQIVDFAIVPAQSIDTAIAPRLGERKASDELASAGRIYGTALKHVLLLYVPAGVGLAVVAAPTIRYVFGPEYLGTVPVLQVFGVFLVINAVNYITTNSLDYLGRGRERAVVNGGTSLANFGLNLLLIPAIGVVGAAVATVVTHAVYTGANLYYLQREVPVEFGPLLIEAGGVLVISAAMGGVVVFALSYVSSLVSLLAVVLVGVGVWAVLSLASGLIDVGLVRDVLT